MKKVSYVLVLLILTVGVVAQEEMKQKFIEETRIEAPVFIGETKSENSDPQNFTKHLQQELSYLSDADYLFGEGIVAVDFIVEADGAISNIAVSNSVSKTLDNAVVNIIEKSSKQWLAGRINGQVEAMERTMYVKFDIPGNESHNKLAANYLNIAIKKVFTADALNSQVANSDKAQKKAVRKTTSAQYYLANAERYKPNDLSITFWQARVYELQGNHDLKQQKLDQYLELVRHDNFEKSLNDDVLLAVISLN